MEKTGRNDNCRSFQFFPSSLPFFATPLLRTIGIDDQSKINFGAWIIQLYRSHSNEPEVIRLHDTWRNADHAAFGRVTRLEVGLHARFRRRKSCAIVEGQQGRAANDSDKRDDELLIVVVLEVDAVVNRLVHLNHSRLLLADGNRSHGRN